MRNVRITTVQRIGNSLGVIVPAHVARAIDFQRGDQVAFAVYENNTITLRKLSQDELLQLNPPIIQYGK